MNGEFVNRFSVQPRHILLPGVLFLSCGSLTGGEVHTGLEAVGSTANPQRERSVAASSTQVHRIRRSMLWRWR